MGNGAVVFEIIDPVLGHSLAVNVDFILNPDCAFYDEGIALFIAALFYPLANAFFGRDFKVSSAVGALPDSFACTFLKAAADRIEASPAAKILACASTLSTF